MIGSHSSEYQDELMLGRKLEEFICKLHVRKMPLGYPAEVYHPQPHHKLPQRTSYRFKPGGVLSNGVPKVLSGELIEGYLLGIYNPPAQ
jgi:hypothetical protein